MTILESAKRRQRSRRLWGAEPVGRPGICVSRQSKPNDTFCRETGDGRCWILNTALWVKLDFKKIRKKKRSYYNHI